MPSSRGSSVERVAVDTGGTFTDFVYIRDGSVEVVKELSTPDAPERAILEGLDRIAGFDSGEIIHGTTVATNAFLERKGAPTALVTTEGFEDVLVIGRQNRSHLYDIFTTRPETLVPDRLRIGVPQRTLYDGSAGKVLTKKALVELVRRIRKLDVEAVAVSLLYSFADPRDEQKIGEALAPLGLHVSLSSDILPEYREYERTSTTVINATLRPIVSRYLGRLEDSLPGRKLRVMQSNGGAVRASSAMAAPVHTILSGPAGGVAGAFAIGQACGETRLITFDMGGTSTDVALIDGEIRVTHESELDGMPIGVPMIDMHTVGAGGGSIAREDAGGALVVGPASAGADPGPICYGKGTELTVTDANVVLGRLLGRFFLGGGMALDLERIPKAMGRLGWTRHWSSPEAVASGVLDVVNNNMGQAIRLISVERGFDVRDFALVTFGGAGGLHAATLAANLGIPRVIVPPHAGVLSAFGLLGADARKDFSLSLLGRTVTPAILGGVFAGLHREGKAHLRDEGFRAGEITALDFLDVRYRGQSYALTVPYAGDWSAAFHAAHEKRYGHADPSKPLEVVTARSALLGRIVKPKIRRARTKRPNAAPIARTRVWAGSGWTGAAVYDRSTLGYGNRFDGPAIVGEYSSTTYVPPGFRCSVDAFGNLVLTSKAGKTRRRR